MEDRDVILKKEVLDTDGLMKLFGVGRTTASKKMKEIRFVSDRLGKISIIFFKILAPPIPLSIIPIHNSFTK